LKLDLVVLHDKQPVKKTPIPAQGIGVRLSEPVANQE
jgi:hypothetical protein